jgi:rod shape-determining protein MreC
MGWRSPRVALAACLAVAMLLLLADLRGAAPTQALRGVVGAVAGPPERALAWVRTSLGERVGGAADERARIVELEQQLAEARAAAAAAAAGTISATVARELAAAAPAQGYRTVPARVVALATPEDQVRSATIDAGAGDGVAAGMAVLATGGLAGLVDSAAPGVATVRLVIDPATALSTRVSSSGEVGVLRGTGQSGTFTLLDPLGQMSVGDLVVTLGTPDGRIPADLPVGRISAITGSAADLTRAAQVTPAVDDSTLDRLGVLVPEAAS